MDSRRNNIALFVFPFYFYVFDSYRSFANTNIFLVGENLGISYNGIGLYEVGDSRFGRVKRAV